MRGRMLVVAVVVAIAAVGGTFLSVQPLLVGQAEELSALTGESQRMSRLFLSAGLLVILDAFVVALLVYVALRLTVSAPLERARVEASAALTSVGARPLETEASGRAFADAVVRLTETIRQERQLSSRRLSELQVSADQKARLQNELVAADRLATVGKLAAGVAHEVGNPLSGILGYLTVLRMRAAAQPEVIDAVERIEAEVKRIDTIVRGLLEMGRPSRGKAQPIDVVPVVDSCVRMVRAMREYDGVAVAVRGPQSAWMRAEAGPVAQVLVNLLINAAQAVGGTGRVEVIIEPQEGGGEIRVEDDGPGIPAEVLGRLFTPFFTTKPPGKGTGLGLAVSRHLLAQFEGSLTAQNRDGRGAAFIITLPR
jgi:two-component system NtrC family sensor kinase